jgi:hypothetical protein
MSPLPITNHVSSLPTGYRFAMASVIDDAKKKGQDAKYVHPIHLLHPINCLDASQFNWLLSELMANTSAF